MKYRFVYIFAALFLIVGMAVQFVISYRQTKLQVQESIDLKTQIAHEKILFELYDAYDVIDLMEQYVANHLSQPDSILKGTADLLDRYPSFYCLHVDFPENFYPEKGKWFSPCSYRLNDSIKSMITGNSEFDYFQRDWYKGALKSGEDGYWGKPYWSDVINETLFTHSDNMTDKDGNPICVVGIDFSITWMQQLLEEFKPFDEAVCVLYTTDGRVLTASENLKGQDPSHFEEDHWILSRQTFDAIDMEIMIAVPQQHIWEIIMWRMLSPLIICLLGVLVVGIFLHRMFRDHQENARLETEKKVVMHELQIAHDIQMGILRNDFPQDEDVTVHADLLPMRDVGGDLYDFFRQGDFLWFIIGDVSGKGVPAALFMSAAVNLFRSALSHQTSPKAIVEDMNTVLSENNPSVTFVTAFVGRLHIPSGQVLFCNAGHLPLLVESADHHVREIKMASNFALGFDGAFKYVEEGFMLREGEKLVLYTDGVTEACNADRKMMGKDQWTEIISHNDNLLEAVKRYIGEAESHDDITLMTICKKSAVQPMSLRVPNNIEQWPLLCSTFQDYAMCIGMEARMLKKFKVAIEEAVVNIMSYSRASEIEMTVLSSELKAPSSANEPETHSSRTKLTVTLTDDGVPFDPTSSECDTSMVINELQIGGLGISLLRHCADELHYQRTNEQNQLTIIKYIQS